MKKMFIGFVVTIMLVGSSYLSYDNYQKHDLDCEWYQMPSGGPE